MRDPVLDHVVQPLVDATGVDPRRAAVAAAHAFLALAIALAALRHATVDPMMRPDMPAKEVYGVVGAAMLHPWMVWTARSAPASLSGALGALAWGMRALLAACAALDLVNLLEIAGSGDVAVVRCMAQMCGTAAGAASLYLAAAVPPDPRRRTSHA